MMMETKNSFWKSFRKYTIHEVERPVRLEIYVRGLERLTLAKLYTTLHT